MGLDVGGSVLAGARARKPYRTANQTVWPHIMKTASQNGIADKVPTLTPFEWASHPGTRSPQSAQQCQPGIPAADRRRGSLAPRNAPVRNRSKSHAVEK